MFTTQAVRLIFWTNGKSKDRYCMKKNRNNAVIEPMNEIVRKGSDKGRLIPKVGDGSVKWHICNWPVNSRCCQLTDCPIESTLLSVFGWTTFGQAKGDWYVEGAKQ